MYAVNENESFRKSLYSFLAVPFVWGTIRGIAGYRSIKRDDPENTSFQTALDNIRAENDAQKNRTSWGRFWTNGMRWLLPLHPLSHDLKVLSRALRWDGRLNNFERHEAQIAIIDLFEKSSGYTKLAAGAEVARTLNSLNRGWMDVAPSAYRAPTVTLKNTTAEAEEAEEAALDPANKSRDVAEKGRARVRVSWTSRRKTRRTLVRGVILLPMRPMIHKLLHPATCKFLRPVVLKRLRPMAKRNIICPRDPRNPKAPQNPKTPQKMPPIPIFCERTPS
jgi:hypothetical protein